MAGSLFLLLSILAPPVLFAYDFDALYCVAAVRAVIRIPRTILAAFPGKAEQHCKANSTRYTNDSCHDPIKHRFLLFLSLQLQLVLRGTMLSGISQSRTFSSVLDPAV